MHKPFFMSDFPSLLVGSGRKKNNCYMDITANPLLHNFYALGICLIFLSEMISTFYLISD